MREVHWPAWWLVASAWALYDAATRWPVLNWSTSDRSPLAPTQTPHSAALHQVLFYRGSLELQVALLALHVGVVVAATCRRRRRPTWLRAAWWVSTVAMQGRMPYMNDGSDHLFANLLLWSVVAPSRGASVGFTMQLVWLYWGLWLRRDVAEWLPAVGARSALECVLGSGGLLVRDGVADAPPWVCWVGTWVATATECAAPWLLLSRRTRAVGATWLAAFHVGIALAMRLTHFSALMVMVYGTLLVPSRAWPRRHAPSGRASVVAWGLVALTAYQIVGNELGAVPSLDDGNLVELLRFNPTFQTFTGSQCAAAGPRVAPPDWFDPLASWRHERLWATLQRSGIFED